jgi:hypothetical protein
MRIRPFLKTRFRAVPGRRDEGDHWLGGEPRHRGAVCPGCKIPLLLLWDINCRDPRFPRRKFGPLDRLPLYFCWGCVSDLAYRVTPQGRLKIFRTGLLRRGPIFQYQPYPAAFERRPLALVTGVPDKVRAALLAWDRDEDFFGRHLSSRARNTLAGYFGHPISTAMSVFHSQFGGAPTQRWWREEVTPCPNRECPRRRLDRPRGPKGSSMSFLAGVLNDPLGGLPMVEPPGDVTEHWWNFFVSVQFQVCGKCWTVRACNRSD